MKIKKENTVINIIGWPVIGFLTLYCTIPFVLLIVNSFIPEAVVSKYGYKFIAGQYTLAAYKYIFTYPKDMFNAYKITIFVAAAGTAVSLFCSSMFAYVLYRKDFKYRNQLAFFIYFTTLFSGGMVSYYIIVIRYLHLKNTVWILLLAGMFSVFHILILRNFMNGTIPDSLVESARMDGAGEFTTFMKIVLPLMKPALACIGLFHALHVWNDWSTALLFISRNKLYPLQFYLYQMMKNAENIASNMDVGSAANASIPKETVKLAMIVVSIGPIILLYPFVQRFFVQGITIGAVKG